MTIKGLDKWLEQEPPDDGYGEYCELVIDKIDQKLYDANIEAFDEPNGAVEKWLTILFDKKFPPHYSLNEMITHSVNVIERLLRIHGNKNG